jgi:diguanylate cyclase (GGDEF)-like protein
MAVNGPLTPWSDDGDAEGSRNPPARVDQFRAAVLAERRDFLDQLQQCCESQRSRGHRLAVLCVDLDRFKQINAAFGHDLGDAVLHGVGRRLASISDAVIASHLAGDEFVLVVPVADAAAALAVACAVRDGLAAPLRLDDGPMVRVHGSVGVALFPDHGDDAATLFHRADLAAYHAKTSSPDHCVLFSAALEQGPRERQRLLLALHQALEREEFTLVLQPKVALADRSYAGAEVLVRWSSPQLGDVPPDLFVPVAEDAGLIQGIGDWVLGEATRGLGNGDIAGDTRRRMAINVSAAQLQNERFLDRFRSRLDQAGVTGEVIEVEVTESALLASTAVAAERLEALRQLGVTITLDDFGTGYSSFSHLKHLPIDALKIAPEFIADIDGDAAAARLLAAMVAMARSLELRVVAEGVETGEQARFLTGLGCTEGQGYLFGRPMAPPDFARWLRDHDVR